MEEKTDSEQELEFLKATLRIDAKILGIVLGVVFGLVIFVATNWLLIKGGPRNEAGQMVIGPHLALLSQYFIGYRVTFLGSLIGFAYAFALGLFTGWLLAFIYNRVAGLRS